MAMKYSVSFEAGTSRHGDHGVNFMLAKIKNDDLLYAECRVPDEGEFSEDYGYMALKAAIIKQAQERGISPEELTFWYDGQEQFLAEDAGANVQIETW